MPVILLTEYVTPYLQLAELFEKGAVLVQLISCMQGFYNAMVMMSIQAVHSTSTFHEEVSHDHEAAEQLETDSEILALRGIGVF